MGKNNNTEKQARFLYPLVLKALNNENRRKILEFLVRNSGKKLAFSEIKAAFPGLKDASLSYHLRTLQMADMVARTVKLEDRYKNPDSYYCFYAITELGEYLSWVFPEVVKNGVEQLLEIKEE